MNDLDDVDENSLDGSISMFGDSLTQYSFYNQKGPGKVLTETFPSEIPILNFGELAKDLDNTVRLIMFQDKQGKPASNFDHDIFLRTMQTLIDIVKHHGRSSHTLSSTSSTSTLLDFRTTLHSSSQFGLEPMMPYCQSFPRHTYRSTNLKQTSGGTSPRCLNRKAGTPLRSY